MNKVTVDSNVTRQDIRAIREEARSRGLANLALELLQNEPMLAEMVSGRWCKIKVMMEGMGLTEEQSQTVLLDVARLILEGIGVVQRSSRRLWDDMLPDVVDDAQK